MNIQNAMQAVIDGLNGELEIVRTQLPEQFDGDPRKGLTMKNVRVRRLESLLRAAQRLQRDIAFLQ
jgi:hypothetical protein